MQISNQFPQFEDKKTVIIVSGSQAADLYAAHNGTLKQLAEVRADMSDEEDQSGRFDRRSGGKTLGVGGVAEKGRQEKAQKRFRSELKNTLDSLTTDFEQIIILSSPQDKPTTRELIHDALTADIILEIDGNFVGEHPDTILEKIKKSQEEKK